MRRSEVAAASTLPAPNTRTALDSMELQAGPKRRQRARSTLRFTEYPPATCRRLQETLSCLISCPVGEGCSVGRAMGSRVRHPWATTHWLCNLRQLASLHTQDSHRPRGDGPVRNWNPFISDSQEQCLQTPESTPSLSWLNQPLLIHRGPTCNPESKGTCVHSLASSAWPGIKAGWFTVLGIHDHQSLGSFLGLS